MGIAELDKEGHLITIRSVFKFYGQSANPLLSNEIALDIERHWNEPSGRVRFRWRWYDVRFAIEAFYEPELAPETVWFNSDPILNFFRIEEFSLSHISFVDGIKSNTGYFKLDNLSNHSTTAAHEYGHTLGLDHPADLDIRGKGQPGIMYPRGTICDPAYQYDPAAEPLKPGGTLNPYLRKVLQQDISNLGIHRLFFDRRGIAVIGDFSGIYHERHIQEESVK